MYASASVFHSHLSVRCVRGRANSVFLSGLVDGFTKIQYVQYIVLDLGVDLDSTTR